MSDLIDRQEAIVTAVRAAVDWHKLANPQYSIAYCIGEAMRQLPSAQPDVLDTNVGDMISREAAIDEAYSIVIDGEKYDVVQVETLMGLPSAQPEQKKGKWIEEIGMLMCSECCDAWGTEQFDEVMSFNFCPNCGAKMEEEE